MAYKKRRPRNKRRVLAPKTCRFCEENIHFIDFKDTSLLTRFITEKGKMIPRRITGNCALHQKIMAKAIKRGRAIALLP